MLHTHTKYILLHGIYQNRKLNYVCLVETHYLFDTSNRRKKKNNKQTTKSCRVNVPAIYSRFVNTKLLSRTGVHSQSAQKGCQAPPPQTRENYYYNKQITVNDFYNYFAMIKISPRSHERNFPF